VTAVTTDTAAPPPAPAPAFEPAALPEGQLACASCGSAVSLPPRAEVFTAWYTPTSSRMVPGHPAPASQSFELTRCEACRPINAQAAAYATSGGILAQRAEAALCALVVLGKPLPPKGSDLAALIARLGTTGGVTRWHGQARPGQCSPAPWAHVTGEGRALLRREHAAILAERMAAGRPPLRIAPPEGEGLRGCLMCGVGHVEVSAVRAVQMGGEKSASYALWHRYSIALPSPAGQQRHEGHTCPACRAAIDRQGSNGPSSRGRALLDYLVSAGRLAEAEILRRAMTEDDNVMALLPAWCATGRTRPSERPWDHLGKLE
jgi:hypothetical protein